MKTSTLVSRNRTASSSVQDSDSATSSEIGDVAEVDDSDFLEFLGDWSESIMFEGVADEIEYGESSGSRFKDESVSSKRRRLEAFASTKRLNSNALLMKISNDESPTSARVQLRKALKTALQSTAVSCPEVLLRGPEDIKLERIPGYLYQAFNGGNLKLVSHIITTSFAQDCTFQTMIMEAPLVGRQHVYKFFEAFTVSHPDIVMITKNSKVVLDAGGRCIKYKFYWTGTNVFPGEAKSYYYERGGNLTKYLDVSRLSKKEIATMKELAARVRATQAPYASVGRGATRLALNEKNEICELKMHWRLLSIKDPTDDFCAADRKEKQN